MPKILIICDLGWQTFIYELYVIFSIKQLCMGVLVERHARICDKVVGKLSL